MFFKKEDPKTLLKGIDKAIEILEERYKNNQVTYDMYIKQMQEFNKRREIYLKKLGKDKYDEY